MPRLTPAMARLALTALLLTVGTLAPARQRRPGAHDPAAQHRGHPGHHRALPARGSAMWTRPGSGSPRPRSPSSASRPPSRPTSRSMWTWRSAPARNVPLRRRRLQRLHLPHEIRRPRALSTTAPTAATPIWAPTSPTPTSPSRAATASWSPPAPRSMCIWTCATRASSTSRWIRTPGSITCRWSERGAAHPGRRYNSLPRLFLAANPGSGQAASDVAFSHHKLRGFAAQTGDTPWRSGRPGPCSGDTAPRCHPSQQGGARPAPGPGGPPGGGRAAPAEGVFRVQGAAPGSRRQPPQETGAAWPGAGWIGA